MTNQCDGCIRGLPLNEYGNHIDVSPGGIFGCTKDRYKKESIGQTIYEQLQEILNKCIDLGWNGKYFYGKDPKMINIMLDNVGVNDKGNVLYMSYHELFSKDSGLMEFVEWDIKDMFFKRDQEELTFIAYQNMCDMKSEEKCNFFVKNAIIPTPLSE